MKLSSVFGNNKKIPGKYTCDGQNINPKLIIGEVPEEADTQLDSFINQYFNITT